MLRYHRPDDAATVDGEDGGDDGGEDDGEDDGEDRDGDGYDGLRMYSSSSLLQITQHCSFYHPFSLLSVKYCFKVCFKVLLEVEITTLLQVHIYHHFINNTFRVVGRKLQDHEVRVWNIFFLH